MAESSNRIVQNALAANRRARSVFDALVSKHEESVTNHRKNSAREQAKADKRWHKTSAKNAVAMPWQCRRNAVAMPWQCRGNAENIPGEAALCYGDYYINLKPKETRTEAYTIDTLHENPNKVRGKKKNGPFRGRR